METKSDTIKKLDVLIRARYPVIVVKSFEEGRVQAVITQIAKAQTREGQPKQLLTWTATSGLVSVLPEQDGAMKLNPVQIFEHIIKEGAPSSQYPHGKPAIYLIKDLHHWLQPQVIRALRDAVTVLRDRHQTIILLSPDLDIPADLKKSVAVIDFPLPTEAELERQLGTFISKLSDSIKVDLQNGSRERLVKALCGLTEMQADMALAQAAVANLSLDESAIKFVTEEKRRIISECGALEYWPEQATKAEIGGLNLLKKYIAEVDSSFSLKAEKNGVEPARGILLVGMPGTGKSLIAKAVAGGIWPLLRLDFGALFGPLVGQSEQTLRNALQIVEAVGRCVLWLDEIEKGLGSSGGERDGGTSQRILATLLTWMQETKAPVFIVATANDIDSLRPELVQRFDETFFVPLPDLSSRIEIISIHLRKRGRDPKQFDIKKLAEAMEGFSGREIEKKVIVTSIRRAFHYDIELTDDLILQAVKETTPLSKTMGNQLQKMQRWSTLARPASSLQQTFETQEVPFEF